MKQVIGSKETSLIEIFSELLINSEVLKVKNFVDTSVISGLGLSERIING